MDRISRFGAAAAVVLVAASLVGCSDDVPEPKVSPSPSASSSADPSPPSSSATPDAETPEAFIERWGIASADMQNSGNPDAYQALTATDCRPCADFIELILGYYAAGGFVETRPWKVRSVRPRASSKSSEVEFIVDLTTFPTRYKESSTAEVETLPGGRTKLAVTLRDAVEWRVVNYLVIAS